MKTQTAIIRTELPLPELASIVNDFFAREGASVDGLIDERNPLERAQGGPEPLLAVLGSRQSTFKRWGVQVYLYEGSDANLVELIAVGHGMLGQMMWGAHNTISYAQSLVSRDALVVELSGHDPRAEVEYA